MERSRGQEWKERSRGQEWKERSGGQEWRERSGGQERRERSGGQERMERSSGQERGMKGVVGRSEWDRSPSRPHNSHQFHYNTDTEAIPVFESIAKPLQRAVSA
ncbi:hypothetical protein Pcinc_042284 [Petrolisthes cinctipes]|uniref:Uncharacterized protein n=1 Tax=Petrolisthes cinctipes TaxID=88211 RepID=A0AAE1EG51_PETCI|nr:hypothetical protein Pcinc_042284 [Petrolisthes cinctipes]